MGMVKQIRNVFDDTKILKTTDAKNMHPRETQEFSTHSDIHKSVKIIPDFISGDSECQPF